MDRRSLMSICFIYLCSSFVHIQVLVGYGAFYRMPHIHPLSQTFHSRDLFYKDSYRPGAPNINHKKGVCCFQPQFEGIFHRETTVFNNKLETTSTETKLHFDHIGKRVCNELSTPTGDPIRIINDYRTGMTYTIMKNSGLCLKKANTEILRPHCIPDNAKFDGKVSINDMNLNRWSTRHGAEKITYIVTDIGCVPVQVSVYNEKMQQVNYFYNISQGITDPDVFNYPSNCIPDPTSTKSDLPN